MDFVSYENIVLKLVEMSLEAIIQIVLSYFNMPWYYLLVALERGEYSKY